jgi:hypothetical protein
MLVSLMHLPFYFDAHIRGGPGESLVGVAALELLGRSAFPSFKILLQRAAHPDL